MQGQTAARIRTAARVQRNAHGVRLGVSQPEPAIRAIHGFQMEGAGALPTLAYRRNPRSQTPSFVRPCSEEAGGLVLSRNAVAGLTVISNPLTSDTATLQPDSGTAGVSPKRDSSRFVAVHEPHRHAFGSQQAVVLFYRKHGKLRASLARRPDHDIAVFRAPLSESGTFTPDRRGHRGRC